MIKRFLSFKAIANLVIWIMLLGGVVFTLGFGICLMIARQEVTKEVDAKVQSQINYLESYVDGRLQRIEDAGFSLASALFGNSVRDESGNSSVSLDPSVFVRPSSDDCYVRIRKFMEANPLVCGIAIEFERDVYPEVTSKYGFTPYVTRLTGKFEQLDLGTITDSFTWEWYVKPTESGKACWISPFRDSSIGHVIASFTVPVYKDGKRFAVIAVDIDTEAFAAKCSEISPYPGASVTMLDRSFRFISHPDPSRLMKSVSEFGHSESAAFGDDVKSTIGSGRFGRVDRKIGGRKVLSYFATIPRTGWMVNILCPEDEVYGGVNRMKRTTTIIAIVSIFVLIVSLLLVFRNFHDVVATKAGIENELKVAETIQMDMLPKLNPELQDRDDIKLYGFQKSAKSVGGDLYDFFVRDDKLFFCIGDVSGKGVPAALYMAVVLSLFRSLGHLKDKPEEIMCSINRTISDGSTSNMFCTLFVGVLDLATGNLEYCNGGHNAPLIERAGDHEDFHFAKIKVNLATGVVADYPYRGGSTRLCPGDALLLYTDGVTEARNPHQKLFGEAALRDAFASSFRRSRSGVRGYVEGVYGSVSDFVSGAEQSDDITMLAIVYHGSQT